MIEGVGIFNALEAAWWLVLAALAVTFGGRARGVTPRRRMSLTLFLTLFGISDAIEVFTGGWRNPPALLVLKAFCLCGLAATAWLIFGERWRKPRQEVPREQ